MSKTLPIRATHDIAALRATLQQTGRIQIRDFLDDDAARAILAVAQRPDTPWTWNTMDAGRSVRIAPDALAAMPESERVALRMRAYAQARANEYQYSFFGSMLTPAALTEVSPAHPMHDVAKQVLSESFVAWMRTLSGVATLRAMNGQFTRYDPGQFLLPHDDTAEQETRALAYVLNLSEDWWPDWGGLLQYIDDERNVTQTFVPHFNSLVVMKVPQLHAVSLVAPFAQRSRFAITGWFIL